VGFGPFGILLANEWDITIYKFENSKEDLFVVEIIARE
jgi:hypothetical protein